MRFVRNKAGAGRKLSHPTVPQSKQSPIDNKAGADQKLSHPDASESAESDIDDTVEVQYLHPSYLFCVNMTCHWISSRTRHLNMMNSDG